MYEDLDDSQIQRMRPDERILQEEFILPVTCDESTQESHDETKVKRANEQDSRVSSDIEIAPGQWAAYFLHTKVNAAHNQSPAEYTYSRLNPLAESFNPQTCVEQSHEQAVNTINSEPRRSLRLQEKRERLMSRTQVPNDIVLQTADVDLACRSTSPSIEEVGQVTSTDQDAIEGDRPDEVINHTRGLDEQTTVEQQVAAQPDDNMSPPTVQDIVRDPTIMGNNYLKDEEFGDMYKYLRYNQLTGDSETDRRLLLIAENYYVENGLLYKIALPRGKQEKRLRPTVFQLCIPKMFRHNLLTQFHDILGLSLIHI